MLRLMTTQFARVKPSLVINKYYYIYFEVNHESTVSFRSVRKLYIYLPPRRKLVSLTFGNPRAYNSIHMFTLKSFQRTESYKRENSVDFLF